jgi:hypothetical protein
MGMEGGASHVWSQRPAGSKGPLPLVRHKAHHDETDNPKVPVLPQTRNPFFIFQST